MQRPFPADESMVQNHPQNTERSKAKNIVDDHSKRDDKFDGIDYSESDPTLKQGIPGQGDTTKVGPTEPLSEDIPLPKERIKNPFKELSGLGLMRNSNSTLSQREGKWVTDYGKETIDEYNRVLKTVEDFEERKQGGRKKDLPPVSPTHPDVGLDIGSQIVDRMMPGEKHNYQLKEDVADYISRRDEMRKWWLEKMKPSFGKGSGAMLGVESPPRNGAIDQAMMMRQYGPAHRPSTTEEWETHLSWAHKRKYFRTLRHQPRWLRYGKIFLGTTFGTYWLFRYYSINHLETHRQNQSYRYSNVHIVDESITDPHRVGYKPRTGYPYFA
eukprot:TRINITY_DN2670_c0_g3_i1.p1 TRINITY_DN2670_c0_g3~~TRINITY_DN2670_c0_g3_i1.p1  ORF type:complete len:327 (+),score=46.47 TRINITY_DN2670_c0_g3_i1:76-1056(+)